MTQKQLKRFKEILQAEKKKLVENARRTVGDSVHEQKDGAVLDEGDEASTEADISMVYRLRDREKYLFKKVEKALAKIDDGSFGTCEECGDDIGIKRLEARPVTDLCIKCKEEQEQREREYAEG